MLVSIWSCAPGVLHVDSLSIGRVIAFYLVNWQYSTFVICSSRNAWVMKLYRNISEYMKLCTSGVACLFIQYWQSYCPWLNQNGAPNVMHSSKSIWAKIMKLNRKTWKHMKFCIFIFACWFIQYCRVIALGLSQNWQCSTVYL